MLIQITIENFLSFKGVTTLSMVGTTADLSHKHHLTEQTFGSKQHSILPISAIYGANAAGKSNLLQAIDFAKDLIIEGTRSGQGIPVSAFKLGDYSETPSKFEFVFTYQGIYYSYGFSLIANQILEEWLYGIPQGKKKEICYFERSTSETKVSQIEFGAILRGKGNKEKQFLEFIAKGTRHNQLFLTEAVDRNVDILKPVLDWFKKILTIIPAESRYTGLELGILNSEKFTSFLSEFLKFSGTGIDSIRVDEVLLDFDSHFPDMPSNVREELNQQFIDAPEDSMVMLEHTSGNRYLLTKGDKSQISLMQIITKHRTENDQLIEFSIDEESEGTQRLINLIPALFLLKYSSERVIFLDELDRRLHPLLSRQFVEFFLSCHTKDSQSQLIFTTHDTNLLDLDLLRRDEVWFVEKNQQGASQLYSLAEFKIRPDLKIEKGYLNGRFGAIPFFGSLQRLGWFDREEEPDLQAARH